MQRIVTDDATPPAGKGAVAAARSPERAITTPAIYEFTAFVRRPAAVAAVATAAPHRHCP